MRADKEYWKTKLPHPLAPDHYDVLIYSDYMLPGETLLLGCTHDLIPMSNRQMDIDPWYESSTVIVQDWVTNNVDYTNIIGDGVLNFSQHMTELVLKMASKHCQRFIVRYFNYKQPTMRIADYFESPQNLPIKPSIILNYGQYSFLIWDFAAHQTNA